MMEVRQCPLSVSNTLVERLHRHHKKVLSHRWSMCAYKDGELVGAAIVGRPVARLIDHRTTVEVNRLVTDGTRNACSALYAAAAREARKRGFSHIITYILDTEPGTSLRAAGWQFERFTKVSAQWSCPSRPREDKCPVQRRRKQRWGRPL